MSNVSFERSVVGAEFQLSRVAAIPFFGTIAGIAKAILGIIQMIGALLAMTYSFTSFWDSKSRNFFWRAADHFVNGFANVVAGVLEGIPFLGTAIYFARKQPSKTGQENILMIGYNRL